MTDIESTLKEITDLCPKIANSLAMEKSKTYDDFDALWNKILALNNWITSEGMEMSARTTNQIPGHHYNNDKPLEY